MMDFSTLKTAKSKASENQQEKEGNIEEILQEAKNFFNKYLITRNQSDLKKSAVLFFKALTLKRTRIEPYFYISSIFFIYEKKEEAIRYLKMAEEAGPDYEYLPKLKQLIYR